ncbi:MAG: adenylate/guanylate cyclase domain-containing protein, partial [Leptospira sp.]|nr:adenylate/guanylate cyclase domain-containing protein [Leptospira sp.]
ERKKSDNLLLNILPLSVAEELKSKDSVIPKHFDSVSVLFTDMAGFTKIAEKMTPVELIGELDEIFSHFDSVSKSCGLEKIKTIGDSYMAAGGLPEENRTNAIDSVLCGLKFQRFMEDHKTGRIKENKPYWELRLGIHTGPVVAGVVGKEKFAYDIWGDTVNTASRLESSGVTGRVNISGATFDLVKDFFDCEHRGKVSAKNKGEIDMYLVNRIKPELSVPGSPYEPNESFKKLCKPPIVS